MPNVDPVILKLTADVARYNADVSKAHRLTDEKLGAIEAKGFAMGQSLKKGFSLAAGAAVQFAAGFATIAIAKTFIAITDEAKKLDAQLQNATRTFGSFGQAQDDVRRIAMETRGGLSETASLYANFVRNAQELGISQTEAARATETVAKSYKISGASAVEAGQGVRQLTQALQSGVLRGDEFNSIMESSPRLARLLADSLGVPVGSLRAMAEEGQLTSDKLVKAFTDTKFTAGIDDEFRAMPVTFEDAMTQVTNAAIITFGAFDRGGQFSKALSDFVMDGATGFSDLEASALNFGASFRAELEGIAAAVGPAITAVNNLVSAMSGASSGRLTNFEQDFRTFDQFTGWLSQQGTGGGLLTGNSLSDSWNGRATGTNTLGRYQAGQAAAMNRSNASEQNARLNSAFGWRGAGTPAPTPSGSPVRAGGGATPRRRASGAGNAEAAERRAEQDRLRAIREDGTRAREEARLGDELLTARAAMARAAADVHAFEMIFIQNEKNQRIADLDNQVRLGALTEDEAKGRKETIALIAAANVTRADFARREAELQVKAAEARDDITTLETEAQLVETRKGRVEAEMNLLKLRNDEEEEAIKQAALAGKITDLDGALANLKRRRLAEEEMIRRNNMSPGERYLDGLQEEAENLGDAYENIAVRGLERMNTALAGSIKSALGLHGILGDIVGDFIEIALRQSLLKPLAESLFGGGGGGGIGGLLGSIFSGGKQALKLAGRASGGYIAPGQMVRVNEGASPGKVEAFMSRDGGSIIPLGQMSAMASAGGGNGMATVRLELSGDIDARIQQVSGPVAVQIVRAAAPTIIDASARETMARAGRPRI